MLSTKNLYAINKMKQSDILLLAAAGGLGIYLWTQYQTPPAPDTTTTDASSDPNQDLVSLLCPTDTVLMPDQSCCPRDYVLADSTCGSCPYGSLTASDASGNAVCCPEANVNNGICQACPLGSQPSDDGQSCVVVQDATPSSIPDLNFTTGNQWGDMAVNLGITIASSIIVDKAIESAAQPFLNAGTKAGQEVAEDIGTKVAGETAEDIGTKVAGEAAEDIATKVAGEAAEDIATKVAGEAAEEIATKLAGEAAEEIATRLAQKAAQEAAERVASRLAVKAGAKAAQQVAAQVGIHVGAVLTSRLGAAAAEAATVVGIPLAIADLCLTAIAFGLQYGLHLEPDSFEPNQPGDFAFSDLPDWAVSILSAIPIVGAMIQVMSPVIKINTACGPDQQMEGGLCYDPPRATDDSNEFWTCQGFLCALNDRKWEDNGMLHTPLHATKRIMTDMGTLPDTCPEGQTKDVGFCYNVPTDATSVVAGTAWFGCPAGSEDQGALCSTLYTTLGRLPDKTSCSDYPDIVNCRDDGTSLWSDVKTTGGNCSGGTCRTWTDGCCSTGLFGECYGCVKTECEPISCEPVSTTGLGQIVKTLMDRSSCHADEDLVGGLCQPKCKDGLTRTGLSCGGVVAKRSQVLDPLPLQCDSSKTNISGLCYGQVPDGYTRTVPGLLAQNCLPNWPDIGVACQRPTYTRAPHVGIRFIVRNRKTDQQDRPPKTCAEYDISDPEVLQACNEALCLADEQIAEGTSQDFCASRCRDSYTAAPNGMCVREAGGTDPASGNPFLADSYKRRNPFAITWGDTMAATSVSESDWGTFLSAGASDVPSLTVNSSDITIPAPLSFNFDAAPTLYTGSDVLIDETGSLNFSAQTTLANGDVLLLAQDGDKVVAFDTKTNSFRESSMGNLVGAFVASAWDSYTAATGYTLRPTLTLTNGATVAFLNIASQGYLSLCFGCPDMFGNPIAGTSSVNTNGQGLGVGSSTFEVVALNQNQIALKNMLDHSFLGVIDSKGTVGSEERDTPSIAATWVVVIASPEDQTVIGLQNLKTRTFMTFNSATGRIDCSNTETGNSSIASTWVIHYG